jgi:hypothetical protein
MPAAGAYDLWHEAPIPEGGWHLMGTRADGHRPDAIGRRRVGPQPRRQEAVHRRWRHVCDFGRGGTIQALALYVADSIKQRLATLFD